MQKIHIDKISGELQIDPRQIEATAGLLAEGATIPFIARYRKEVTGSLDEVAVTNIRDRLSQLEELEKRRQAIFKSLTDQGKLTDELKEKIDQAETIPILEDIYLPYRPNPLRHPGFQNHRQILLPIQALQRSQRFHLMHPHLRFRGRCILHHPRYH